MRLLNPPLLETSLANPLNIDDMRRHGAHTDDAPAFDGMFSHLNFLDGRFSVHMEENLITSILQLLG